MTKKKIVGIYLLKVEKYRYVGQSIDINTRVRAHKSHLKLNKHNNQILQNAYNKHQMFDYEILWEGPSNKALLEKMEQKFIDELDNSVKANIANASLHGPRTKEHKDKISKAHKRSKKVQASIKRAMKARLENGQTLTKERQSENRRQLNEVSRNRYFTYTKFSFQKGEQNIVSTVYEFAMITGINKRSIEAMLNHRQTNTYGWTLNAVAVVKEGELLEG